MVTVVNLSAPPDVTDKRPRMQYADWLAEGQRRFGRDFFTWRFVCPVCKHVQAVSDFEQFKDQGVEPDAATHNCIGRYTGRSGHLDLTQPDSKVRFREGEQPPCNYTAYGLFRLAPLIVVMEDGSLNESFAFAD